MVKVPKLEVQKMYKDGSVKLGFSTKKHKLKKTKKCSCKPKKPTRMLLAKYQKFNIATQL